MDAMSSLKTGALVQTLSSKMPPHLRKGSLLPEAQWKSIQRQRNPRLSKSEWLAAHGEAAREEILREIQRQREIVEKESRRQKKLLEKRIREEQRHQEEDEEDDEEYDEEYDEEDEEEEEEEDEEVEEQRGAAVGGQTQRQAAGNGKDHSPEGEKEDARGGLVLTDLSPCMKYGRINLDPPQKKKLSQIDEAKDKIGKAFRKHEAMKQFKFDPEDDFIFQKRLWDKAYVYKKPWLVEELLLK